MKEKFYLLFVVMFLFASISAGDKSKSKYAGITTDDDSHYTTVGNISLTITNFGTYGNGFTDWPDQPSCEYPIGSGIENIFDGGLWVGGFISDNAEGANRIGPYVTTGAVDASSVSSRGGGFEYTNESDDHIVERSSLLSSSNYSPKPISHQDLIMNYADTNTTVSGETIEDHDPLGIAIHHEAYAWNYSFADFFVIMNYWIKNVSDKYIDSVYVGLWTDTVVRNTNITGRPSGSDFFNKGGNGYNDSLHVAYEFDATGDIGFTDNYIGIQFLGTDADIDSVNFVTWQYKNTDDPRFFAPDIDPERYKKMRGYFGTNSTYGNGVTAADIKSSSNRSMLLTAGAIHSIAPGDSVNVVFAIVAAKKSGSDLASLDTEEQKAELYTHAGWALRAYNGEDRNGDGILDPEEDLDGDGEITRYVLPSPPKLPNMKVVPESQKVTIYWDKSAEESIDPISGKKDFEGYRVYRTNAGYELGDNTDLSTSFVEVADFDSAGNDIGYNTGFSQIELAEPMTFSNDDTEYYYKFEINNLLNGWQYTFTVTSYDEGDPDNDLDILESSLLGNATRVLPGTTPTSDSDVKIGVYPNPYYGNAYWDGASERLRKIYFYNLPAKCKITIYTLAGDIVKKIDHDQSSNGSDIRWFDNYAGDGSQIMSGGEHAWDLISNDDQAIATGLYLFSVEDLSTGDVKLGKFLVIK